MTVLAIILCVLLGLLALVFALLCLKLSVRIVYKNNLTVYGGISFVRIKLFPRKEKKIKNKHKKNTNKTEKQPDDTPSHAAPSEKDVQSSRESKTEKDSEKPQDGKKKSITETVTFIFDIVKQLGTAFGRHGSINVNAFIVTVSKEDACDTAVSFGLMCSAMSAGLALCSLFGKSSINHDKVMTIPDFVSGKSSLEADIKIGIRGIFLLIAATKVLMNKYVKNN